MQSVTAAIILPAPKKPYLPGAPATRPVAAWPAPANTWRVILIVTAVVPRLSYPT